MAASIIDVAAEEVRKEITGDDKYAEIKPYAFVLRAPDSPFGDPVSPVTATIFPLVVNPDRFEYTLPYAAEVTALQEGGVVADENGFVIGEIVLEATTGFKLRKVLDTSLTSSSDPFTDGADPGGFFSGPSSLLSGHMHFWRLANRCFGSYSELKKDPEYSSRTTMEFHSMKDDLHLLVVPREFRLTRSAATERVTYRFSCRMSVVGAATDAIEIPSPDVGLLQSFKNTVSKIRSAVQGVSAAIDDVTAAIDEIRRAVSGIAGIITDVKSILSSAQDLLDAQTTLFKVPAAFITATAGLVEEAAALAAVRTDFPPDVAQALRQISDGLDRIRVAGRDHFIDNMNISSRKYDLLTDGPKKGKDSTFDSRASALKTEAAAAQGRMSVQTAFGGPVKPGDAQRSTIPSLQSRNRLKPGQYNGFTEKLVGQGDTIQSLAAKHLGDARKWLELALINQLKAPWITTGPKLPGTLQPGSRITIPLRDSNRSADTLTTGTATLGASQIDAQLGRDYELKRIGSTRTWAWVIDTPGGSVDAYRASGFKNLEQAIEARFRTTRGENILYPAIGRRRLVGRKGIVDILVDARYDARAQLVADPRVQRIMSFKFTQDQDTWELEADVLPLGSSNVRTISRTLT